MTCAEFADDVVQKDEQKPLNPVWKGFWAGMTVALAIFVIFTLAWNNGFASGVMKTEERAVELKHGYWGWQNGPNEHGNFHWGDAP